MTWQKPLDSCFSTHCWYLKLTYFPFSHFLSKLFRWWKFILNKVSISNNEWGQCVKLQTNLNGQFHTVCSSLGPALCHWEEPSLCVPLSSNLFCLWGFKPKRKELVYIVLAQYKIIKFVLNCDSCKATLVEYSKILQLEISTEKTIKQ